MKEKCLNPPHARNICLQAMSTHGRGMFCHNSFSNGSPNVHSPSPFLCGSELQQWPADIRLLSPFWVQRVSREVGKVLHSTLRSHPCSK